MEAGAENPHSELLSLLVNNGMNDKVKEDVRNIVSRIGLANETGENLRNLKG